MFSVLHDKKHPPSKSFFGVKKKSVSWVALALKLKTENLGGGSGGLLKWLKRPVLKTGRWMEYSTREFKSLILRHNMGQDGNDLKCAPFAYSSLAGVLE